MYVIDTGVRISHKDFGGRASYGWDFVEQRQIAQDGNGHGTHVAGTVAGTAYGVAKKAKVVAVRVLDNAGGGTTAQVIAGIDWVTRHARKPAVANMSLGGYRQRPTRRGRTQLHRVRGHLHGRGRATTDVAAGLHSPARVNEAITVGATDWTDARARLLELGLGLDLFAPGVVDHLRVAPSDTGPGEPSPVRRWRRRTPRVRRPSTWPTIREPHPSEVAKALVATSAGKVTDKKAGSPNKLLLVAPVGALCRCRPRPPDGADDVLGPGRSWVQTYARVVSKVPDCLPE